jgi:hypothetical protein
MLSVTTLCAVAPQLPVKGENLKLRFHEFVCVSLLDISFKKAFFLLNISNQTVLKTSFQSKLFFFLHEKNIFERKFENIIC